jgi:enoyl-CoA hydratase
MSDIRVRKTGRAGRITLTRPKALNAVTWDMIVAIDEALGAWADDPDIALVVIDAEGERAFSAGGDIVDLYRRASVGDFDFGRRYWAREYRVNARIAEFPKPYVAFCQGFTMGGGVGVSLNGSHRVVGDSSKIAMPECAIGLVPDVGGTAMLARGPGHLGEYLGTTGYRMGPGDAILAGFADHYLPEEHWQDTIAALERTGDIAMLLNRVQAPPAAELTPHLAEIDAAFSAPTLVETLARLAASDTGFATKTLATLARQSPVAAAAAFEAIRRVRAAGSGIRTALETEYRFAWRAAEQGDFIEGIRAAIIDRDTPPKWKHADIAAVTAAEIDAMLAPVPEAKIAFVGSGQAE